MEVLEVAGEEVVKGLATELVIVQEVVEVPKVQDAEVLSVRVEGLVLSRQDDGAPENRPSLND